MLVEAAKFVGLGIADSLAIPVGLTYGARKFYKAANKSDRQRALKRKRSFSDMPRGRSSQRSTQTMSMSRSRSRSRPRPDGGVSIASGHYHGRLRKPGRAKKPSVYEKYGYVEERERFGEQSLTDVCYVGATSFCHSDLGAAVGIALIRKLMKRHFQYEYTNIEQLVVPYAPGTFQNIAAGPRQINFYYEEITSAATEPTIAVGWTYVFYNNSAATVLDFAQNFYTNVLSSNTFGQDQDAVNYPKRRLHGYQFGLIDANYVANETVYTTVFPLANQYMTCYSSVVFGIQNVTPSDTGSLLTTHVDVNPVKGKMFHYKDLLPRLRERNGAFGTVTTDNSHFLQIDPNGDGIIKPDPNFSLTDTWLQVPNASHFANCDGQLNVYLNPGSIKDYKLFFKFNGTLEKFMNGFSAFNMPLQKGAFGTCILFALEKMMPTGQSAVKLNFSYESKLGCVFGKRLGAIMPKRGFQGVAVTTA